MKPRSHSIQQNPIEPPSPRAPGHPRSGLAPEDVAHHTQHQAPERPRYEGHRKAQPGGDGGAVEEMASVCRAGHLCCMVVVISTDMYRYINHNHSEIDFCG